jgi:hypothetical protein
MSDRYTASLTYRRPGWSRAARTDWACAHKHIDEEGAAKCVTAELRRVSRSGPLAYVNVVTFETSASPTSRAARVRLAGSTPAPGTTRHPAGERRTHAPRHLEQPVALRR